MADAMEAITDVMNEVQVRMNGEDVRVKMAHKVEQGGSVGRAKLGYLNVRKDYGGRLVNTIDVDPERAPLVAWAFEQYATGEYSISQLRSLMEEQGLTTRPSPSRPSNPVSNSRLAGILRDPYYTGVIRYRDKLYAGRHEPLISKETFLKVQEILDQRRRQGDRDITHFHYMKGIIYCGECYDAARTSRLLYSRSNGNGGTYEYFICTAKQRRVCSTPAIRVDLMEARIAATVAGELMTAEALDDIRELIAAAINDLLRSDREAKAQLRRQLDKLEAQEERLIELAANSTMPIAKVRTKLERTTLQKEAVTEKLNSTVERLNYGAEMALAYIELLRNPGQLYQGADSLVRRELLTALFKKLKVYVHEESVSVISARTGVNTALRELYGQHLATRPTAASEGPENAKTSRDMAGGSLQVGSGSSSFIHGLSKNQLAGVPGLEPRTKESESFVLPITPHPIVPTEAGTE
jgi:site-specific DNA recombinase